MTIDALQLLPKNASPVRLHNRCKLTGRPKGYNAHFWEFHVSYSAKMANKGLIPGVKKSKLVIIKKDKIMYTDPIADY